MAEVRAFQGIRYRLERPEAAEAVIAPPYDVISPAGAEALRARDPHNVVRLELPAEEPGDDGERNRYTRAAELYRQWVAAGVLARDAQPCLYVYGQRYSIEGRVQERLGLLGALEASPYEQGVVLPHEQTFPKHREDRFRLLSAAAAQFSPIFALYSAPGGNVRAELDARAAAPPAAAARDAEGVEHRLWPVADARFHAWAAELFAGRQVFIADGHHRYETALRYRAARRAACPDAPPAHFDRVMTFLVEMDDPGLVLLPTHRMLRGPLPPAPELRRTLERFFTVEDVSLGDAEVSERGRIGLLLPGGAAWRLTLADAGAMARLDQEHSAAWRELDVTLLHRLVLGELLGIPDSSGIVYTRDPEEARRGAASGEFAAVFMLPAPSVEDLKQVAGAGDRMPEKSTYFWPKAVTGLVIYGE